MRAREITKRDVIRLLDKVGAKPDARQLAKNARKPTHRPNQVFELVRAIFRWAVWSRLMGCAGPGVSGAALNGF